MAADKSPLTAPPTFEDTKENMNHYYVMLFDDRSEGALPSVEFEDEGRERRISLHGGQVRVEDPIKSGFQILVPRCVGNL